MAAVGNTRGADAAAKVLEEGQKRLATLGPKLPGYQALIAQRDAATTALAQARQGLQAANAQVGAADPAEVSSVGPVSTPSKLTQILVTAVPVAGAGLLVAVLLVALLEILARRKPGSP